MGYMAESPTPARPSGSAPEPALLAGDWNRPPSFRPWAASLALHVTVVSLLAIINPGTSRPDAEIAGLEDLLDDSNYQLVYHKLEDTLPAVAPEESPRESAAESKARFKAPRTIVASDPDPRSSRQMIWTPEPAPEITEDVASPNVLVWTPPDLPLPRFEPPRLEMKEAESSRPDVDTVADTIDLESLQPIQRLRYQAEPVEQQRPNDWALHAAPAPEMETARQTTLDLAELQEFDPLRYWTAEQSREAPKEQAALAGPAPKVGGAASSGFSLERIKPVPKLRFQMKATAARGPVTEALEPTLAPTLADLVPAGPRGETGANAILTAANASLASIPPPPPNPTCGASGGAAGTLRPASERRPASSSGSKAGGPSAAAGREGPKLAVVGAKPSATGTVPFGRRRGRFSASPSGGPGGEGVPQTPGAGAGVRIPNLSISGRPRASFAAVASVASLARAADGPARPARFDRRAFLAKLRNRPLNDTTFGNFETEATPENPEAGFSGRRVHTLAINMPNINSGAGSWIVRFSEAQGARSKGKLFAPAPRVKVDPTYARAAISERIEGEVILSAMIRNDGVVDHVKLIKSVDERLDQAAIAALGKWEFHPALKGGVPVDVQVVVRIPFRLKPLQDP